MRFRSLLAVLGGVLCLLPALRAADAESLLNEWAAAQPGLGDLSVDFKLTRQLPALKEPVVTDGHFWRLADGRFRWELGRPVATVLVYDNATLHLYEAEKNQWQALGSSDRATKMWMQFLDAKTMAGGALAKDFTAQVTGEADGITTLALVPRGMMTRKHVRQVDLQIDPVTRHLRQMRILQADGGSMLMSFAKPQALDAGQKDRLSFEPKL